MLRFRSCAFHVYEREGLKSKPGRSHIDALSSTLHISYPAHMFAFSYNHLCISDLESSTGYHNGIPYLKTLPSAHS